MGNPMMRGAPEPVTRPNREQRARLARAGEGARMWRVTLWRPIGLGQWEELEYITRTLRTGSVQTIHPSGFRDSVKPLGAAKRCRCGERNPNGCAHCILADAHLSAEQKPMLKEVDQLRGG